MRCALHVMGRLPGLPLRRLPVRIRLAAAGENHLCHHHQRAAGFGMRGCSSCSRKRLLRRGPVA